MDKITVTKEFLRPKIRQVDQQTHKGVRGHALIIGGSYGKMGSVCLSSKAALRSGCGLVSAVVPKCGYAIMQIAVPEAMVITAKNHQYIDQIKIDFMPDSIGIGPGLGKEKPTVKAYSKFLRLCQSPVVIDADAINILSKNPSLLPFVPHQSVLTPHHKELERLIGKCDTEQQKILKVADFAKKFNTIVVVKGAPTLTVTPDGCFLNSTGNPSLATAGSGDVLTGIITGLLAQGYSPEDASVLGVFIHGLSADLALEHFGKRSLIASDIIAHIPKAWLCLEEMAN